jgi:hypothetical protein
MHHKVHPKIAATPLGVESNASMLTGNMPATRQLPPTYAWGDTTTASRQNIHLYWLLRVQRPVAKH